MLKGKYDTFNFSGAKKTYATIGASAIADLGRTGPSEESIVDITATAHGFLAGPTPMLFNCAYILGSTNYAGLKRILSVPDANSIYIFSKFTAETPGGTETLRTAITYPVAFEFLGFEIHLSAASATAENLVIAKDANRGSAYDTKIYSEGMNTVQDIAYMLSDEEPVVCEPNDVIDLTWNNTNNTTWTIKLYARSI